LKTTRTFKDKKGRVVIPPLMLNHLKIVEGSTISLEVKGKKIIITKEQ